MADPAGLAHRRSGAGGRGAGAPVHAHRARPVRRAGDLRHDEDDPRGLLAAGADAGREACDAAIAESGLQPPDTTLLAWRVFSGPVEHAARHACAAVLEMAVTAGELRPGARGWERTRACSPSGASPRRGRTGRGSTGCTRNGSPPGRARSPRRRRRCSAPPPSCSTGRSRRPRPRSGRCAGCSPRRGTGSRSPSGTRSPRGSSPWRPTRSAGAPGGYGGGGRGGRAAAAHPAARAAAGGCARRGGPRLGDRLACFPRWAAHGRRASRCSRAAAVRAVVGTGNTVALAAREVMLALLLVDGPTPPERLERRAHQVLGEEWEDGERLSAAVTSRGCCRAPGPGLDCRRGVPGGCATWSRSPRTGRSRCRRRCAPARCGRTDPAPLTPGGVTGRAFGGG